MGTNEYKEYWETVESIAKDIVDSSTFAELENHDCHGRAWETVDGSEYVSYYYKNIVVLEYTDNEDAFNSTGMGLDTSKGWRSILTQVAFCAMLQDVQDKIERLISERIEKKEEMIEQYTDRANAERESGTEIEIDMLLESISICNEKSGMEYFFQNDQYNELIKRYEDSNVEVFNGEMDVEDLILADLVNW